MGFLDSIGSALDGFMKAIKNVGSEAFDSIKNTCSDLVRAVREGDWAGAIKECVQVFADVASAIEGAFAEVNKVIFDLTGLDKLVEPLLAGLKTIGEACVDSFKKYPSEWLEVAFSFIGAAVLFALGDVPQGAGLLISGVTKVVRLFDIIEVDDPGFSERFPLPPQLRELAEKYQDVPNRTLDAHLMKEVEDL